MMASMPNASLDEIFEDADQDDDQYYGLVRNANYHDWNYCNRRRRSRFIEACNGNRNGDCSYLDDPNAFVTRLRPLLPSPSRELSYLPRTGWRYEPSQRNAPFLDRLGTGVAETSLLEKGKTGNRQGAASVWPKPSTEMTVPASWSSSLSENTTNGARKRGNATALSSGESHFGSNKKQKVMNRNDAVTIVTNSTADQMDRNSLSVASNALSSSTGTGAVQVKQEETASTSIPSKTPSKILLSPKEALFQWYAKKPRKTQLTGAQFLTWDTGNINDQLFCSIFVCPLTSETFLAVPHNGTATTAATKAVEKNGLYWFSRKNVAEHAAAARAFDSLTMRESGGRRSNEGWLSVLEPYWPSQKPKLPLDKIPAKILEKISDEHTTSTSNNEVILDKKNSNPTPPATAFEKVKEEPNVGKKRSHEESYRQRKPAWNQGNRGDNRTHDVQQYRSQRMRYGHAYAGGNHHGPTQYQSWHDQQQAFQNSNSYTPYHHQGAAQRHNPNWGAPRIPPPPPPLPPPPPPPPPPPKSHRNYQPGWNDQKHFHKNRF